jgi:hypothetical protein
LVQECLKPGFSGGRTIGGHGLQSFAKFLSYSAKNGVHPTILPTMKIKAFLNFGGQIGGGN